MSLEEKRFVLVLHVLGLTFQKFSYKLEEHLGRIFSLLIRNFLNRSANMDPCPWEREFLFADAEHTVGIPSGRACTDLMPIPISCQTPLSSIVKWAVTHVKEGGQLPLQTAALVAHALLHARTEKADVKDTNGTAKTELLLGCTPSARFPMGIRVRERFRRLDHVPQFFLHQLEVSFLRQSIVSLSCQPISTTTKNNFQELKESGAADEFVVLTPEQPTKPRCLSPEEENHYRKFLGSLRPRSLKHRRNNFARANFDGVLKEVRNSNTTINHHNVFFFQINYTYFV